MCPKTGLDVTWGFVFIESEEDNGFGANTTNSPADLFKKNEMTKGICVKKKPHEADCMLRAVLYPSGMILTAHKTQWSPKTSCRGAAYKSNRTSLLTTGIFNHLYIVSPRQFPIDRFNF